MKNLVGACLQLVVCVLVLDVTQALNDNICNTKACTQTASVYSAPMNRSKDPCNDFYNYICGIESRDHGHKMGFQYFYNKDSRNKISTVLNQTVTNQSVKPFQLLKTYFNDCSNTSESEDHRSYLSILSELGFDLKLIDGSWVQNGSFNWQYTIKLLAEAGLVDNLFFNFDIKWNRTSPSHQHLIVLRSNDYTQKSSYNSLRELIYDPVFPVNRYIEKFLTDFNNPIVDVDNLQENLFQEVYDFENELVKISHTPRVISTRGMTIKDLSIVAPNVPWVTVIQSIVGTLSNLTIDENQIIFVENVEIIRKLEKLIHKTPSNVLFNYIVYGTHMSYLVSTRNKNSPDYANKCVDNNPFEEIVPVMLANAMTPEDQSTREYILNLSEKIKEEFLKIIEKWDWMDNETNTFVMEQLRSLRVVVGFEDLNAEIKTLENYYNDFELPGQGHWILNRKISKFQLRRKIKKLQNPVDNNKKLLYKTGVAYIEDLGLIYISTDYFLDYYVSKNRPEYLNLANIGWDIASEMAWGLLVWKQRVRGQDGKEHQWSDSSLTRYLAKLNCVVNQYITLSSDEIELVDPFAVNDILTQSLGLNIVYRLYQNWLKITENPQWKLPNYNINTLDQMLFTIAGSKYCEYSDEDFYSIPAKYIFEGIGLNVPELGEAWSCQANTRIKPAKRCTV